MTLSLRLLMIVNLLTVCCSAAASEESLLKMRQAFLQAEQYLAQGRDGDYSALADTLKDYPLYPYLQYQWLKNHLDDAEAVQAFSREYAASRYASLLHRKWLQYLGEQQQWLSFLAHYRKTKDAELQCYYAIAQYQNGQQAEAINSARQLWLSGKSRPTNCNALFDLLKASAEFNSDLVWQRFRLAMHDNNTGLAEYLVTLLPISEQAFAKTWLKLHHNPQSIKADADWKRQTPQSGLLFAHAIQRWLNQDPQAALQTWDEQKEHFDIPPDIAADTEKDLAVGLALSRNPHAYARLSGLSNQDNTTREWRVRAALGQQNWDEAAAALASLNDDEKQQDKWQYWQARTLKALGRHQEAEAIFRQLAQNRNFYGFLAAEHLQQAIVLNDQPVQVSAREIEALRQQTEFQAAAELLAIDRQDEAKLQWWHAVGGFNNHKLAVAAKLAQQWQWPSIAIFTIAKASDWGDIDLRFPLQHLNKIQDNAAQQSLDPAIIFGLIRQESAFDERAGSPAGAKGLMQIMPQTGRQIASHLQDPWSGDAALLDPATNVKYGSYYYKKLLNQFGGHYLLATAAYNAGPNRVKRWLPAHKPLPGDIWVESIPYKETRGYVSSVILYALIYQQRLQRHSLKTGDLVRAVMPGGLVHRER